MFKNVQKNKKLASLIIFPLIGLMFVLLFLNTLDIASSASCYCDPKQYYDSETIYAQVDCEDCRCVNSGEKLFRFQGLDSECEKMPTEKERLACYNMFNQRAYECERIDRCDAVSNQEAREICYQACSNKYPAPAYTYYHGGPGTFIANKNIKTGGYRTYLLGFDAIGEHKIMTGFDEPEDETIIFRRASRDVEFGGNFSINGGLELNSKYSGLYFDADPSFREYEKEWIKKSAFGTANEKVTTSAISSAFRGNGLDVSGYLDNYKNLMLTANDQAIMRFYPEGTIAEKGVEITGRIKTDKLLYDAEYNSGEVKWSGYPIDGWYVLYNSGP